MLQPASNQSPKPEHPLCRYSKDRRKNFPDTLHTHKNARYIKASEVFLDPQLKKKQYKQSKYNQRQANQSKFK